MAEPMLVRRLALDLRDLSDKALSLRGGVEDYRHDLVRTVDLDHHGDQALLQLQQEVRALWAAMDRTETKLRTASRQSSQLLWPE